MGRKAIPNKVGPEEEDEFITGGNWRAQSAMMPPKSASGALLQVGVREYFVGHKMNQSCYCHIFYHFTEEEL